MVNTDLPLPEPPDTLPAILSRRERNKRRTAARIVDAALRLFEDQGYEQTSIEQIAEAADVSRATFFNYYPTKEALLIAIAVREVADLRRLVQGQAGAGSPLARARHAMRLLIADTVPFLRVTKQVLLLALMHPTDLPSPMLELEAILGDLARLAQEQGELRDDLPAKEIARAVIGIYLGALFGWAAEGHPGQVEFGAQVDRALVMLFDGIAPRTSGA